MVFRDLDQAMSPRKVAFLVGVGHQYDFIANRFAHRGQHLSVLRHARAPRLYGSHGPPYGRSPAPIGPPTGLPGTAPPPPVTPNGSGFASDPRPNTNASPTTLKRP